MTNTPIKALSLFSGGLDSILASLLIARQGIQVTCLHYCTPFFGKPHLVEHWSKLYGLKIVTIDISQEFVDLLRNRPDHNFGKVLNPCVDCKILMISHARKLRELENACCIISGEVLGQRPMSQRKETLNIIRKESLADKYLLRPLSALHLEPTFAEDQGLIDRTQLKAFSGRGRKLQMELAKELGLTEIPTPAGGCRLADTESAKYYWPVLERLPNPKPTDFLLANSGRQAWQIKDKLLWLITGRNQADNDSLMNLAQEEDLLFKVDAFPGPIALGRQITPWSQEDIAEAASLMLSYAPKAMRHFADHAESLAVRVHKKSLDNPGQTVCVKPTQLKNSPWEEPSWETAKAGVKQINVEINKRNNL